MSGLEPTPTAVWEEPSESKRLFVFTYEESAFPPIVSFVEPNQGVLTKAENRDFYTDTETFLLAATLAGVPQTEIDAAILRFTEYE